MKYELLFEYLNKSNLDQIELAFSEVEDIIKTELPASASKYNAWWGNGSHTHSNYWLEAGYSANVQIKKKRVIFIKDSNALNMKKKSKTPIKKNITYKLITEAEIVEQHKLVLESLNYGKELEIMNSVFNAYPDNVDLTIIAMKVAVLDVTNSTQLSKYKKTLSLFDVANIILNIKDFDSRVKDGDPELVNEIARQCKNVGNKNLFSFATKYCCYHNNLIYKKDDYSIYDSVLGDNLNKYIIGLSKSVIKRCKENYDYKTYNDYIETLLNENKITVNFRRRKLDHFIWYKHR